MEVAPEKIGVPVSLSGGGGGRGGMEKVQPQSHLFIQSVSGMSILGCTQKKTCIMEERELRNGKDV